MLVMDPKFIGGPFGGQTLSKLKLRRDLDVFDFVPSEPVVNYRIKFKTQKKQSYLYDIDANGNYAFVATVFDA